MKIFVIVIAIICGLFYLFAWVVTMSLCISTIHSMLKNNKGNKTKKCNKHKQLAIADLKIKDLKSKLEEANMYVGSFGADCNTLQDKLATVRKQVCDEIRKEYHLDNNLTKDKNSVYFVNAHQLKTFLDQIEKGDKE